MDSISVSGGQLEGWTVGSGEPVLFIHGVIIADAFRGLEQQPDLADSCQLISYHRRGFFGSVDHDGAFSIAQQAADARAVLSHYGIDSAHVVGHSYGGAIALQLAMDTPELVASLGLLEPTIFAVPAAAEFMEGAQAIAGIWASGDKAGAVGAFLQAVGGPDYRAAVDQTVPDGWFDQAVSEVDVLFEVELPALGEWLFGPEQAAGITLPSIALLGEQSAEIFQQGFAWQQEHLPGVETFTVPGANHILQMMNPSAVAGALASFVARHRAGSPALPH